MTLRIALELYLKRAMVGGADRVYEIGRIFRNEGIDSSHSAEFTMLESYAAWGDQFTIAATTQQLIVDAADRALGTRVVPGHTTDVNLDGEWAWLSFYPGLSAALGEEITVETPFQRLKAIADARGITYKPDINVGKLAMELFGEIVEHSLAQPTFVCDYPAVAQPLARPHRDDPRLIEAWDLIVDGVERATGFSELIDPVIQRERLTEQSLAAAAGDLEAMQDYVPAHQADSDELIRLPEALDAMPEQQRAGAPPAGVAGPVVQGDRRGARTSRRRPSRHCSSGHAARSPPG